jgi:crotonobetainyl-CoA:carnitine CoA-transferase CaiB-like acyl-CoA transferase
MMGGLAYMTGLPGRPMRAGSSVIDIAGGMFGVIGILSAIEERHRTGLGQKVASSLFETTAFMVGQHMAQQGVLGEPPPPMSVRRSAWSIYDIFECADEHQVFVGVVSDSLWKAFCGEFGLQEFADDAGLASNNQRVEQRQRIMARIVPLFRSMSLEDAVQRLERAGIPFAPINQPADLFEDEHLKAHDGLVPVTMARGVNAGKQVRLPALPLEMGEQRFGVYRDLPPAGRDTREILRAAGYAPERIERFLADGTVEAV